MSCADTGRDPMYVDSLNIYGWCPTPANPGCVWFNLPWGGKQEITVESEAAILAEVAKQKQGTFQDYQQLFIMLDEARCGSAGGFFVRNIDDGTLTPWNPPAVITGPLDVSMPITPPVSGTGGATNITPTAGSTTNAAPPPAAAPVPVQTVSVASSVAGEGIIEQGFDTITRALVLLLAGALLFYFLTR